VGRLFTQGGGLGGLALGYYLAAPGGAPEAAWQPGDAEEWVVVWRTIGRAVLIVMLRSMICLFNLERPSSNERS